MNVYDFDNTILRGDSTARFFAFCMRRYPRMWLDIPAQAANGLLFVLRLRKKQAFKQRMLHWWTPSGRRTCPASRPGIPRGTARTTW